MNTRKLKKKIIELLSQKNFEERLDEICQWPARQVVNPLFSLFYSTDERIKWRAVTAMGAVVSCSRPIVDAKWLEKARQVGTSGQTVKPKVYLACGISGSFQHLGGIKGAPFIVAINKNPKAPIFQVSDVGIEADILDFLPELTERIAEG